MVAIGDVRAEYRKQSVIELKPTDTLGRYLVKDLPWPKLSLYDTGNGGNHAYLVIPLVLASVVNTGVSTYSTADLCKLTGLNRMAISRLMPRLSMHFNKVGSRWTVYDLHSALAHGTYAETVKAPASEPEACILEWYREVVEEAESIIQNEPELSTAAKEYMAQMAKNTWRPEPEPLPPKPPRPSWAHHVDPKMLAAMAAKGWSYENDHWVLSTVPLDSHSGSPSVTGSIRGTHRSIQGCRWLLGLI
jgi:hypothetical protein